MAYSNTNVFAFGEVVVETVNQAKAKNDCERLIIDLKETLKADQVILCLSDRKANFRKEFDPTYKSQRASEKPTLWYTVREFIESGEMDYPMVHLPKLEGDDVLGLMATHPEATDTRIMVSIDKDMKTIPGLLYNPQKPDLGVVPISQDDADRWWMTQTLTGDATDGYPGLRGCGPKNAEKFLFGCTGIEELWEAVVNAYAGKGFSEDDAINQARLARILRHGDYNTTTHEVNLWHPSSLG